MHRDAQPPVVAADLEDDVALGAAAAPDRVVHRGEVGDADAVDGQDDVARLQPGRLGRAVDGGADDVDLAGDLDAVEAEPGAVAAARRAARAELAEDRLEQVDRDEHVAAQRRSAAARGVADHERADADELAVGVEETGAAVVGARRRGEERAFDVVLPVARERAARDHPRQAQVALVAAAREQQGLVGGDRRRDAERRRAMPSGASAWTSPKPEARSYATTRAGTCRPSPRTRSTWSASRMRYPMVSTRPSSPIRMPEPCRSLPSVAIERASSTAVASRPSTAALARASASLCASRRASVARAQRARISRRLVGAGHGADDRRRERDDRRRPAAPTIALGTSGEKETRGWRRFHAASAWLSVQHGPLQAACARPADFPDARPSAPSERRLSAPVAQGEQAAEHAAQVSEVGDPGVEHGGALVELEQAVERDQVLGLHRDHEEEQDDPVRKIIANASSRPNRPPEAPMVGPVEPTAGYDVERVGSGVVLSGVGAGGEIDALLLGVGGGVADGGVLVGAVGDEDGGHAFAHKDAVGVPEAGDRVEVGGRLEVEDFEGAVILGSEQEAIAVVVGGEVIEVARVAGEGDGVDEFDGTGLSGSCGAACVREQAKCRERKDADGFVHDFS